MSADAFVTRLADKDIETVLQVVETQAGQLKNPTMTTVDLLAGLEEVELRAFVHRVRSAFD